MAVSVAKTLCYSKSGVTIAKKVFWTLRRHAAQVNVIYSSHESWTGIESWFYVIVNSFFFWRRPLIM
jgi:hypothetical protein